jgi:hypothetical protein
MVGAATMKIKLIYMLKLLILVSVTFGQTKRKSIDNKTPLDLNAIEYILIRNHSGKSDTIKTIYKQLDAKQCKQFVEIYNNAKAKGLSKYVVEYWVEVVLRNGTIRVFRVNSNSIKETTDDTFDLGNNKYLETLWNATTPIKQVGN